MTCAQCGAGLAASTRFCTSCGAPTSTNRALAPSAAAAAPAQSLNGLAVVSLVLGLLGGSVLALVFGYIGRSQIKRSNGRQRGSGLAVTGIVLGWIGVAASIALVVLLLVVGSNSSDTTASDASSATDSVSSNADIPGGSDTGGFTVVTTTTRPVATTITGPKPFGTYRITDSGVIIRSGPGTTYPELGRIPPEMFAPFTCRVRGEGVVGPYNGPPGDPWWDKVTYNGVTGFVTDEYVDNQADVSAGRVLPPC